MAKYQAQKAESRDRVKRLLVGVTLEERAGIAARAASVGMPVSAYLRAAGLVLPLTPLLDRKTVQDLVVLHGALGRIETGLRQGGRPDAAAADLAGLRARLAAALEALE
jgi:hypothetical protein